MRPMLRAIATLAATAALLAALASTALAGNYAEVLYSDPGDEGATAGSEREIRFTLLQHGVTAVEDGPVLVTATLPGSDPIQVEATSHGGGIWSAVITFPTAGAWQLRVTHAVFETPPATELAVGAAPSVAPGTIPVVAVLLLAGAILVVVVAVSRGRSSLGRTAPEPIRPG